MRMSLVGSATRIHAPEITVSPSRDLPRKKAQNTRPEWSWSLERAAGKAATPEPAPPGPSARKNPPERVTPDEDSGAARNRGGDVQMVTHGNRSGLAREPAQLSPSLQR